MAFEEKSLDPTIGFDNVTENKVRLIAGKGQMVYWQGCNVSVIEKDGEGKEHTRKLIGMPNGQGLLESGTELYITSGRVKEG
ncbi:hypothetical protein DM02DRAFT_619200 [Periconia macrospinosa]|uniref:Uncharacterized protein n=1 Tax=Periconia macrospinosa TaxID=97972 RepID=A0A2V1D620_9PLEO|nr:hypothetical protein DM02DRAFT_619200 [Periconia macrospinosa]